jgi:hypothetical protein
MSYERLLECLLKSFTLLSKFTLVSRPTDLLVELDWDGEPKAECERPYDPTSTAPVPNQFWQSLAQHGSLFCFF